MTDFRELVATLPPGEGRVHVISGPVARIRFDHKATRNALDPRMMVALADAVDAVRDSRVVLVSGAHGTVCSGGTPNPR